MSPLVRFILVMVMPIMLLIGCYNVSEYSGDGHLVDNGVRAATDRYVLNLGSIDLNQRGTKTYRIANLPEINFLVGIEISVAPEDRATIEKRAVSPDIYSNCQVWGV